MKRKIFLLMLFTFIVFPFSAKAVCTNSKKAEYMSMAQNITTAYTFNEDTKKFSITLSNIPEDFKIRDVANSKTYEYTTKELVFHGYKPGVSYRFDVSMKYDCIDGTLMPIYVVLPVYNPNYKDDLCKGYEDYDICQKWGKYISDHDAFEQEIESIKEEKTKEKETGSTVYEYKGIFSGLARVFTKTYYIALPLVIIAGLIGIYVLNKKEKLF